MELDTSSIEKRFAYGFLQQLLKWMDISQEFIAHLGEALSSGSELLLSPPSSRVGNPPSSPLSGEGTGAGGGGGFGSGLLPTGLQLLAKRLSHGEV